jgi:multimeric flavodoxin WrbA
MARLLIVHHTPSPAVRELLEAAVLAAEQPELHEVEVHVEPALSATASDLLGADAVLLLTPANIGYMSGALKHFFDTVYYPCLDASRRMPWALIVHGNDDTAGAVRSVTRIAEALQWRQIAAPVEVTGPPGPADRDAVANAAGLLAVAATSGRGL